MKDDIVRRIQREGAEALLDAGVSLPLARIWFFGKRTLRATMRRPTLGGQIRIARLYLKLNTTAKDMRAFTKEQQMAFLAQHGKTLSRMVAVTLTRGYIARHCFEGVVAWYLRQFVAPQYLMQAVLKFVLLLGTEPFTIIISSAERTNPMKLRLSHHRKGSIGATTRPPIAPSASSGRLRKRQGGRSATSSTA